MTLYNDPANCLTQDAMIVFLHYRQSKFFSGCSISMVIKISLKLKVNLSMFTSVTRGTNVSTAQSRQESSSTNIGNIRSAAFDFQQTGCTLETKGTIKVEAALCWLLHFCIGRSDDGHMCTFMLRYHSLTLKNFTKNKGLLCDHQKITA